MKRINKINTTIMVATITMISYSCKKDSADTASPDTLTLLQNKNWKISAITIKPAYFGISDVFNGLYFDCEKDDIYRFQDNGVFVLDAGPLQCDTMFAQQMNGIWNYNSSTKNLHFELADEGILHDIVISSIQENTFTGASKDTISDGPHVTTWTFTKQ